MSDAESPIQPEKPAAPTAITKVDKLGRIRSFTQGADGKFQKLPRRKVDVTQVNELARKFLATTVPNSDGKIDKKSKKRLEQQLQRMYEISTNDSADPKAMMAAVKAFEVLWLRAYGKPSMSPEDSAALQRAGVNIVIVPAPVLMHPEPVDETPRKALTPSFIEGEFTTTDSTQK